MLKKNRHLPLHPLANDIYLVEYPKSGITWLCFLIANSILLNEKNKTLKATFYNIQQFINDVQISRDIPLNNLWNTRTPRFIKSHFKYRNSYNNIIYLIRDPLSVMISYHKYLTGLNKTDIDFSEFVKSRKYGIDTWVEHVSSWTRNVKNGQRLHLIRYENLIHDPQDTLAKLFENIGLKISSDVITEGIDASSMAEMKNLEKTYRSNNPFYNLHFVRKGGVANENVDASTKDYIESRTKNLTKIITL